MTEKKPKNLTSTTNELNINSIGTIELTEELKSFMDDTENRLNKLADRLMENEIFKETCAKRSLKD